MAPPPPVSSLDADVDRIANAEASNANAASFGYVRSWSAIAGGVACGVLGLTGAAGLAFYVALHVFTSLVLLRKIKFDLPEYVSGKDTSVLSFVFAGVGDQALSFILFWTLAFAVFHVYWGARGASPSPWPPARAVLVERVPRVASRDRRREVDGEATRAGLGR